MSADLKCTYTYEAIAIAVKKNNVNLLLELTQPNLKEAILKDEYGNTLLHYAAINGSYESLKYLVKFIKREEIDKGIINLENWYSKTALQLSIEGNYTKCAILLLKNSHKIKEEILLIAVKKQNLKIVQDILKWESYPLTLKKDREGNSIIGLSVRDQECNILKEIIKCPTFHNLSIEDRNVLFRKNNEGSTIFNEAVIHNNFLALEILIEKFPEYFSDLYERYDEGDTILHTAAEHSSLECLELLLKYEDIRRFLLEREFEYLKTPLYIAITNRNLECVKAILEYPEGRQSILVKNLKEEITVLHIYSNKEKEYIPILKEIFMCNEYHQIINVQEKDREETPLHVAINYDSDKIVWLLLHHGADYTIKNGENETPFDKAREQGAKYCKQVIRKFKKENSTISTLEIKEPDCE